MTIYRRDKLMGGTDGIIHLGAGSLWTIQIPTAAINEGAEKVYVTIEVMHDAAEHHAQYARLEKFGPYSNWDAIKSLAIALEYKRSNDTWGKVFVQPSQHISMKSPAGGCARMDYLKAMTLYTALQRIEWQDLPSFLEELRDVQPANVREVMFDEAERSLRVSMPPVQSLPSPTLVSEMPIRQAYANAGLRITNSGRKPPQMDQRDLCDCCYAQRHTHATSSATLSQPRGGLEACVPSTGSPNRCVPCETMQRPCSWTPVLLLPGWDVLVGRPPANEQVYPITEPKIETFGELEKEP